MNKIFKLVWNRRLQIWVVASELTKTAGRQSTVVACSVLFASLLAPNVAQSSVAALSNPRSEVDVNSSGDLSIVPVQETATAKPITTLNCASIAINNQVDGRWTTIIKPRPQPIFNSFWLSDAYSGLSTFGLIPEQGNLPTQDLSVPFIVENMSVVVNDNLSVFNADRSRMTGIWVERVDDSSLILDMKHSQIYVDGGNYARRVAGIAVGKGDEKGAHTINLNNVTIDVTAAGDDHWSQAHGITDAGGNDFRLVDTSIRVRGDEQVWGGGYYPLYRTSESAPKCGELCAARKFVVDGKTVMTVEGRPLTHGNSQVVGWSAGMYLGGDSEASFLGSYLFTAYPGGPVGSLPDFIGLNKYLGAYKSPPMTVEIQGESITNLKSTDAQAQIWSYRGDVNGVISFKNAKLSGTVNDENGITIRGGGEIHFEGDVLTTSPIRLLTDHGKIFIDKLSGDAFTLSELRSMDEHSWRAGSTFHLGDKTLVIDNPATVSPLTNRFSGEFIGSPESKLIKRGATTWTLLSKHPDFKGEVVVEEGTLQMEGSKDSRSRGARLTTVKGGATLMAHGYGPYHRDSSVLSSSPNHIVIEPKGALKVGKVTSTPDVMIRNFTVRGDLTNQGEIHISQRGGPVGNALHVLGNYHGEDGSVINMATSITPSSGWASRLLNPLGSGYDVVHDKLLIHGDSSGQSAVKVFNLGKADAGIDTFNGPIKLITVAGKSDAEFRLIGRGIGGAYEYALVRGKPDYADVNAEKNWYLVSDVSQRSAEVALRPISSSAMVIYERNATPPANVSTSSSLGSIQPTTPAGNTTPINNVGVVDAGVNMLKGLGKLLAAEWLFVSREFDSLGEDAKDDYEYALGWDQPRRSNADVEKNKRFESKVSKSVAEVAPLANSSTAMVIYKENATAPANVSALIVSGKNSAFDHALVRGNSYYSDAAKDRTLLSKVSKDEVEVALLPGSSTSMVIYEGNATAPANVSAPIAQPTWDFREIHHISAITQFPGSSDLSSESQPLVEWQNTSHNLLTLHYLSGDKAGAHHDEKFNASSETTALAFGSQSNPPTPLEFGPQPDLTTALEFVPQPDPRDLPEFGPEPEPKKLPEFGPQPEPKSLPEFGPQPDPTKLPEFGPQPDPTKLPEFGPEPEPTKLPEFGPEPEPMIPVEIALLPDPTPPPESDPLPEPTPPTEPLAIVELTPSLELPPTIAPAPLKPVIRPEAGTYATNSQAVNTMFQMRLNDRLGGYYRDADTGRPGNAWVRYSGSSQHLKDSSGQLRTHGDKNTVQMGIDMLVHSSPRDDQLTLGIMGGYGHYHGDTKSKVSGYTSTGKVDGHGLGIYGTYQQNAYTQTGMYADSWLLWNRFDNKVKGDELPSEQYKSKGLTASLELGYNAQVAERNGVKFVLQPHAQVMYQNVRSDGFRESYGTRIEFVNHARTQTMLGLRAAAHIPTGLTSIITPHIEANWLHASRGYSVRMDETRADVDSGRNIGQLKLGVEGEVNQRLSLNAAVFHNQGNAGYHETGGNVSVSYRY